MHISINWATQLINTIQCKSEVDQLDIDKLEKVPTGLNSLKSNVDKVNVNKSVPVSADLSKQSDVVRNDIKKTDYDELVKNVNAIQTTDTSNLV